MKKPKKIYPITTGKQWKKKLDSGIIDNMNSKRLVAVELAPNGDKAYIFDVIDDHMIYKEICKELGDPSLEYPISTLCEIEKCKNTSRLEVKK